MKEEEREIVMQLCSLFEVVEIEKEGVVSYWRYDFDLKRLIKVK